MDPTKLSARMFALDATDRFSKQDGYGLKSVARQMVTEYFANPANQNFAAFNEAHSWLTRPERTPEQQRLGRALYEVSFEIADASKSFEQAAAALRGVSVKTPSGEVRANAIASLVVEQARDTEGPASFVGKSVTLSYMKDLPDQKLWPINLAIDELLKGDARDKAVGRAMSDFLQWDILDGNRVAPDVAAERVRAGAFG